MQLGHGIRNGIFGAALLAAACAKVEKVEVTPDAVTLTAAGQKKALVATAWDQGGGKMAGQKFEYRSSDETVATVNAEGEISAVRSGTATITTRVGEKGATTSVDVRIPTKLSFAQESIELMGLGSTAALTASVSDDTGRPIGGAQANFQVENPAIAAISGNTVTAISLGSTTVTASFGSLSAATVVSVALPTFAMISAEPAAPAPIKPGEQIQLLVAAKSAEGVNVAGVPISFTTGDAKVATVDPSGKIVGTGPGSTTVSVISGDKTATVKVVVRP